jgi:CRP/FNR family transcriptional regulator, anaerobic regulatory protein
MLLQDGREQVTGFHLAGDTLGLDAVGTAAHPSEAVALEDAWVCAIPYQSLMQLSRRAEPVQHYVQRLLSRELVRDQGVMLMLGRMQAAERVAAFLLGMAQRYKARGLSAQEFVLPMVREDIGNYLGLTLETVSRCLSRFKRAGLIEVDNRRLHILDHAGLQQVIGAVQSND